MARQTTNPILDNCVISSKKSSEKEAWLNSRAQAVYNLSLSAIRWKAFPMKTAYALLIFKK